MRKLTSGLLAFAVLVGVAACGDSGSKSSSTSAAATTAGAATTAASTASTASFTPVTPDTLTVVTSLPGPGFWNGDDPDHITGGYEYAIAQAMQAKLGLKNLKIINVSFDALVAGQVQDYDVALSQVTITDDRKKVVDFTTPYFESDQGVLVKAGTSIASLADAQKLQWAAQSGTTGEDYLKNKVKPAKEAQVFQDLSAAFAALTAGQVDAVIMDTAIVLNQAAQSNGKQVVGAQFKTGEEYGGILPKGSKNADAINAIIAGLKADGSLAKFAKQWLGGDPSSVPVISVP